MRRYLLVLVAAVGIACGRAATPTAPSSVTSQVSTGFFTSVGVFEDLASEITAGVQLLRSRPEILDQLIASGTPYTHVVFFGAGHNLPPVGQTSIGGLATIGKQRGLRP